MNDIIYAVYDNDYGFIKMFKSKHNAVNYMYRKSKEYGVILYSAPDRHKNRIELSLRFSTEDNIMIYLYECNEDELNCIFKYFDYYELSFED